MVKMVKILHSDKKEGTAMGMKNPYLKMGILILMSGIFTSAIATANDQICWQNCGNVAIEMMRQQESSANSRQDPQGSIWSESKTNPVYTSEKTLETLRNCYKDCLKVEKK